MSIYIITATVTGIVFGLSLVRVIVAVLIAVIIVMRWRKMENKNIKTPEPSSGMCVLPIIIFQLSSAMS